MLVAAAVMTTSCAVRGPAVPAPDRAGLNSEVDYRILQPAEEGEHALRGGQSASPAGVAVGERPLPAYPSGWIDRGLPPLSVDVLVVVDTRGRASEVQVDAEALRSLCGSCAEDFAAPVHSAVSTWAFMPLEIADWVDGPDEDGDGEPDSVVREVVEVRPYSLRLRFFFSVHEGIGRVEQTP